VFRAVALGVLVAVLLAARPAGGASLLEAADVTHCGQVVGDGEVAELRGDLDCAAPTTFPFSAEGVHLSAGATLRMNGFAIRGDGSGVGITCFGPGESNVAPCTVEGPGEIRGFWAAINGAGCALVARDVVMTGNSNGIVAALSCRLEATRIVASDNAELGIWATDVHGRDVDASRNGGGGVVASFDIHVKRLRATDNGREGIRLARFRGGDGRIVDSVVVRNERLGRGFDIAAAGRLQLVRTRCGRSAKLRYRRHPATNGYRPRVVGSFGCARD
jgi:hypothetical protein